MCHFELTAREAGLDGEWKILKPDAGGLPQDTEYIITWSGR